MSRSVTRRDFLKLAGGVAAGVAGSLWLPGFRGRLLQPAAVLQAADPPPDLVWAGTDGWMGLPRTPAIPPFHPDPAAPAPFTTYIFGFRNVTGLSAAQVKGQKMKAQHTAPLFWLNEYDDGLHNEFRLQLTNLGLAIRPDLVDAHTLHWHGFRNVIPFFDGEPHGSVSVPIGRVFTYVYRPRQPGTYMYHCHVEDVEHVHMGMTGVIFVRPALDRTPVNPGERYAYNDPATAFDREFVLQISEVWAEAHWCDAHIQLPDWSDYHPDFVLLNGRAYPDTIAPNGAMPTAT